MANKDKGKRGLLNGLDEYGVWVKADDGAGENAAVLEELPGQEPAEKTDLSTRLLMRIVEELSAIKSELSSLKKELHNSGKPADNDEPEEQSALGFFDDEDDGKIAFTGDEIDTILNTADFAGEGEAAEEAGPPEGGVEIPPELKELQLEGVEPMTSVTEDTSFLEEDAPVSGDGGGGAFEAGPDFAGVFGEEAEPDGGPDEPPGAGALLEDFSLELAADEDAAGENAADALPPEDEAIPEDDGLGEIELNLDDSGDLSLLEDDPFGETDPEETPDAIDDSLDDDSYDQVIPEGFLVEAEEGPAGEEKPQSEDAPAPDGGFDAFADIPPADAPPLEEDAAADAGEGGENPPAAEAPPAGDAAGVSALPEGVKAELRSVLAYMDQLLEALPDEKIAEFARSEQFNTYKKLFAELGLS
jgi:hypothetical protein